MRIHLHPAARRGKIVVLVAVLLPTVLIPILALAVDGGSLMEDRRRLQAAVDAAALAAAAKLYQDNSTHNLTSVPPPITQGAKDAALGALGIHGFTAANCEIRTVNLPATSSNPRLHGAHGTIEVVVTHLLARSFSAIWESSQLKVTARAVARMRHFSIGNGIIILEDTDDKALLAGGNGTLIVNEGGVFVNSTSPQAAFSDGLPSVLAATSFNVTGCVDGNPAGGNFYETPFPASGRATPYTGSVPVPDPLRNLPEPKPLDYPEQTAPPNSGPPGTITLLPGRYTSRVQYDGRRTIVLQPGIYFFEQGLSLQGQATLTGNEVMLYNSGSGNNNFDLAGLGTWTLTPPKSGPYQGICMFQSRNTASQDTTAILRGNGGAGVTGTIYMPTTKTTLVGNGNQVLGSQFIGRTLEMAGNGTFTVNYAAEKAPQPLILELVE